MIHEILIVPTAGAIGGEWHPGAWSGVMHEVDIVDGYVRALCDELDLQRIRHRTLPTRNQPGIPYESRHEHIEDNQLVLHCRIGWDDRPVMRPNWSHVTFGRGASNKLARIVSDALGTWGRCYVFGHESRNPTRDTETPLLNVAGAPALEIVPFAINGHEAGEYARRLRTLGRDLAWAIHEYIGEQACTGRPAGALQEPPKAPSKLLDSVSTGIPSWVLDPETTPLGLESPTAAARPSPSQPKASPGRSNAGQTKQKTRG